MQLNGPITRRRFLCGSALALAGAPLWRSLDPSPPRPGAGRAGPAHPAHHDVSGRLPVWSAARQGDRYVGLAGTQERVGLFRLRVGPSGVVALGEAIEPDVPSAFSALAVAADGEGLLLAGAEYRDIQRVTVDNRRDHVRPGDVDDLPDEADPPGVFDVEVGGWQPAVYRIVGDLARPVTLPDYSTWRFAWATAVARDGAGALTVVVERSEDNEGAFGGAVDVVRATADDWSVLPVARGLGEGGPTRLAVLDDGFVAVVADGDGRQRLVEGSARSGRSHAVDLSPDSVVLGFAPRPGNEVEAFIVGSHGPVRRVRRRLGGRLWREEGPDLGDRRVIHVVPVSGTPHGEAIAVGPKDAWITADRGAR